jgi:hypothetical protein
MNFWKFKTENKVGKKINLLNRNRQLFGPRPHGAGLAQQPLRLGWPMLGVQSGTPTGGHHAQRRQGGVAGGGSSSGEGGSIGREE